MSVMDDRADEPIELTLDLLTAQLGALDSFVQAYRDALPADSSPDERARLRQVNVLLDAALTQFT